MNKTILITGASKGLGAQMAKDLAKDNIIVVHYNSSKEMALEVSKSVEELGGKAHLIQANLSSDEGCNILVEYMNEHFDSLDVLINNAGYMDKRNAPTEIDWGLLERTFYLNVFGVMRLTSQLLPLIQKSENDPQIINLTSIAARTGSPTSTVYGASKGALDSYTRGLAKEVAPNIRVNAIAPGFIETPFHDNVTSEEFKEKTIAATPMKCMGNSEHISKAVVFLIENSFITGETLDINGGLHMR